VSVRGDLEGPQETDEEAQLECELHTYTLSQLWSDCSFTVCLYTVEPLNNGHVGTRHFVLYREVVLSSEVTNVLYRKVNVLDLKVCPLYRGFFYCVLYLECPLSEVLLYTVYR
jgi:hypothetical protein